MEGLNEMFLNLLDTPKEVFETIKNLSDEELLAIIETVNQDNKRDNEDGTVNKE